MQKKGHGSSPHKKSWDLALVPYTFCCFSTLISSILYSCMIDQINHIVRIHARKVKVLNSNTPSHSRTPAMNFEQASCMQTLEKLSMVVSFAVSSIVAFVAIIIVNFILVPETGGGLSCSLTPRPWCPTFQWLASLVLWYYRIFYLSRSTTLTFVCAFES